MRRYVLYGVIFFQLALIVSLVRGIQLSRKSSVRIAGMEEIKSKLEEDQAKLREEAEYVESPYYLEKVARDELHMSKPGETVVIVPDSRLQTPESSSKSEQVVEKENWRKWWEVLSGAN